LRRKIQDNRYSQVKLLEPKDFKPEQINQIIKTIAKDRDDILSNINEINMRLITKSSDDIDIEVRDGNT
jgi:hypothetical protein